MKKGQPVISDSPSQPSILKSSRHSKIAGNFGEQLVLYWLSKHGFECALVDHVGIDLIARNPKTDEVMGISVKSRTRGENNQTDDVRVDGLDKIRAACASFRCVPYVAVVVDAACKIRSFILPLERLERLYSSPRTAYPWRMTPERVAAYYRDPQIKIFELQAETKRWW